jgi:hypothetical protein
MPLPRTRREPLFDAYLIVDWSASSQPKTGKDSIWYFLLRRTRWGKQVLRPNNPPTRHAAQAALGALLEEQAVGRQKTLLGFDFPYGYPKGLAGALALPGKPWRALWNDLTELIQDDESNHNNRFEVAAELNRRLGNKPGPFWACPSGKQTRCLSTHKPNPWGSPLEEFRLTDNWLSGPQSPWKLFTAGCVGSQALLGIPRLARLRDDPRFASVSRVWPFETRLRAPDFNGYCLVHAEIYPSLIPVRPVGKQIKDALQVEGLARHFARLDEAGDLQGFFQGPPGLTAEQRRQVEQEEGWILGVG